jgi:SAM-dependent methyltransferase
MNGFMNPAEFDNIRASEEQFWWYRGMRAILFRLMEPYLTGRPIGRALEAGCGTGYLSQMLERERGWPMVALDYGWEGLCHARELGAERVVRGDVRGLPFGDAQFDLTLSLDVLVHMAPGEEHAAAREMARVTRLGGLVVVRAAAFEILRSRHAEYVGERQRYTRRRLQGLFTGAGIRVLRCTYANTLLAPVALVKFRVWEPLMRTPVESGVGRVAPWLDRLLYAPLAMEAGWIGGGHNLPVGQSVLLVGERMA